MLSANSSMSALRASAPAAVPPEAGFGIYVHWPFCRAKCPYCDFNVHLRESVDEALWLSRLATELDHFHEQSPSAVVTSIFFGGGTPSLMSPATVAGLIEHVGAKWRLADNVEISLEANPNDWHQFAGFRSAGVTRLSLGVQSFDDEQLRFLGRDHTAEAAAVALDAALGQFGKVSCDLIYALPGQTPAAWRQSLISNAPRLPGHLSLYQLSIEVGTAFYRAERAGTLVMAGTDEAADFYAVTQETCDSIGRPAYEISNHAVPDQACRHNLTYWRGGDYVGVGPGAHGRITIAGNRVATHQYRNPETWLDAVQRTGCGTETSEALDRRAQIEEAFLLGLRAVEGLSREHFCGRYGIEIEDACAGNELSRLASAGLMTCDDTGVRTTAAGRPVLDAILGQLLAGPAD